MINKFKMEKEIKYTVKHEVIDNKPVLDIDILYKDEFEENKYSIKSDNASGINEIPFNVIKNNKNLGKITLKSEDIQSMFEDFFTMVGDYDFQIEFFDKKFKEVKREIDSFLNGFNKDVIDNELTLEGEIKRMRAMAGLLKDSSFC